MNHARLNVKVIPGARRDGIAGRYADGLKIRVSAPPEAGRANSAVIQLVADAPQVPARQVTLVRGQTHPRKVLQIQGLTQDQLEAWVQSFT